MKYLRVPGRVIVCVSAIVLARQASAQTVATLWKARGLEAQQALDESKVSKTGSVTVANPAIACSALMEFAYALHAQPTSEISSMIRQGMPGKAQIFHLILSRTEDDFLDVSYNYLANAKLDTIALFRMPAGWRAVILKTGWLAVDAGRCTFFFPREDPFRASGEVIESDKGSHK